jgi:hypothetical protein
MMIFHTSVSYFHKKKLFHYFKDNLIMKLTLVCKVV